MQRGRVVECMTAAIARAPIAPLLREPSLRSEQVSQLVLGETARVEEARAEWRRVTGDPDGYSGWVHLGYLVELDRTGAARWREEARGWSLGAEVRSGTRRLPLPLRARVVLEGEAVRLPGGARGRVSGGVVSDASAAAAAARAQPPERWALERFAGAPYQWGGVTPWGVDCSGLVQTTFAARGIALPRDAALQVGCGAPVPAGDLRPGDLLFFRSEAGDGITHVAFAAEGETLIHSTVACGGVLEESWAPGTRAAPLRERMVAVRRLEER